MPLSKELLEEIEQNKYKSSKLFFLDYELDDDDVMKLTKALKKNTFITSVNLYGSRINNISAIELSKLDNIQALHLRETRISSEGVRTLIASKVKFLDLSSSGVEDDDLIGIESNTTLKKLIISPGYITEKGVALLSKNKCLESIDIRDCRIKDDVSDLFLDHPTLIELYLDQGEPPIAFEKKKKKEIEEIASSSSISSPISNPISSSSSSVQKPMTNAFLDIEPMTYSFEIHREKYSSGDLGEFEVPSKDKQKKPYFS